ncbi:glycosyltransferase [Rugamonas sp. A1-17]|nr:glycosyltransferase [Rugamonas sp. A1-17]
MLKIVHLSSAHPRDDSRIFGKQCRTLAAHGHQVTLVVADGLGNARRDGVTIVDAGAACGRLDRMLHATCRVYRCARALDADIVQLHDPELLPAGLLLRRPGRKVVFDAHEDVPLQLLGKPYLNAPLRRLLSAAYARFERRACARLDGVIAATPVIRDKFLPIQPGAVAIRNYPQPEEFSAAAWDGQPLQVCYVGGLSALRGIAELVRACTLLRTPVRVGLAGRFSEPALAARMRAQPGWERVDAHGVLGRDGVAALMAASRAGLVTLLPAANHLDALPVKLFEYMAAGIAVIASDFPLWRRIVDDAGCGLCVDPRDPAAIAAAIDRLAGDPALARRMGQNGRAAVLTRYHWRGEAEQLLRYYENL